VSGSGQTFDPAIHCAGGVLDVPIHGVLIHKTAYEAKQAELRSAVEAYEGNLDHGEHEDVMDAIKADPPWPSYQLRSFLLAKGPLREASILAAIRCLLQTAACPELSGRSWMLPGHYPPSFTTWCVIMRAIRAFVMCFWMR
jgi:hypothetical protein